MTTDGFDSGVIETLSNGTWTAQAAPMPSDVAPGPSPGPDATLSAVACTSVGACTAVGYYTNTSGTEVALVETLSGTTWTAQPAALPHDVSGFSNLTWLSCPTAGWCMATGEYESSTGNGYPLTETVSAGGLTGAAVPLPGDAQTTSGFGQGFGLSCPTTTFCAIVGWYENLSGDAFGFIGTLSGGSWKVETTPLPSGPGTPEFGTSYGVACPTASLCTAVGFYDTGSNEPGVINTWNGSSWSALAAPLPSDAQADQPNEQLETVSCPTAAFCMTSGNYTATGGNSAAYVDTLAAGSWTSTAVPLPSNSNPSGNDGSYAKWVTCYSPVACTVVGSYTVTPGSPGNTQGLLDTWTGAQGYWLDATDGGIFTYPNNAFFGSTGSIKLNKPMVGMDPTPDGQGYWLVASDGGIFTYGDAQFHGSRGGQPLNKPIVGMATTPDGQGYWLVASDGGIFTYGDANYYGSRGGQPINAPIVGMAATPDGGGYWIVGADGGIYSYGDALFHGSTGSLKLNKPVVGIAGTPSGLGYWLVASDGGIFNYGDANFYGSTGSIKLNKPVVGMASSPSGLGYWLVASDGGVFNYGDAPFQGSAGSLHLNAPVVGMAGG